MIRVIYLSFILQMKQSLSRNTYKFCFFVQPILYTILMYAMYSISEKENFISFVILGTGIMTLWSTIAFSSASDLDRERRMGTFKYIFCAPVNYKVVVYSKVLGNTLLGLVPLFVLLLGTFLFNREAFVICHPRMFILAFFLTILSFVAISLVFSAIFSLSRSTRILMNCIEFPIYILCGIVFPVMYIPIPIRFISYILTPTWAIEVLRMSIDGIANQALFNRYIIIIVLLSIAYFILSHILFKIIDKKARIHATLEVS